MPASRISLSLIVIVLSNVANAAVFMEEAASVSGYGPSQIGYSMYYSGACGERVGASVSYVGRAPLDEALPDVMQYARNAASHIVARCPAVKTIEVDASGQPASPPKFYRFEMNRSDDWAPTDPVLNSSLTDALIAADYLPVRGPQTLATPAFIKFGDARLDVIYGKNFESRMVATHFEKMMMEGAEPPRLSHYIVRGYWYELGGEQAGERCENSREGYPLWGSFSMTLEPFGSRMRTQRKRCVDHDDQAKSEPGAFTDLDVHDFEKYGVERFKIASVLSEQIESAGNFAESVNLKEFASTRQPLYTSDSLRLYASQPDLCAHRDFEAVYRVNNESRDSEFGGNYQRMIGRLLKQVANEHCDKPGTASVDNFSQGDTQMWDHMSFQLRPIQASAWGGDEKYLELLDHDKGPDAKAHDAWLAANLLGPACTDVQFCSLPGGRYLNAVYRGDLNSIRQMDYIYAESVRGFASAQIPEGEGDNPLRQLFSKVLTTEEIQLLREAANKYLYSYAAWGNECLDAGAEAKTFRYTTPVVIETDEWGATTRSGGDVYEATYTLNPEFFGLRDRIGSANGARDSDNAWNRPELSAVFKGIVDMKSHYNCRSREVKQFEQQLLTLTNTVLAEPGTTAPTADNKPPQSRKVVSRPFPPVPAEVAVQPGRIAVSAPVALPEVATSVSVQTQQPAAQPVAAQQQVVVPAGAAVSGATTTPAQSAPAPNVSGMSPIERAQKMSRELQDSQQVFREEMNVLNQSVQQGVRTATTADARTRVLTDYQTKLADLQRRMQAENQRIQQQYQ